MQPEQKFWKGLLIGGVAALTVAGMMGMRYSRRSRMQRMAMRAWKHGKKMGRRTGDRVRHGASKSMDRMREMVSELRN